MGTNNRAPRAASHYAGLRLTITQPNGSRDAFVALSTKRRAAGWDEWSLLIPTQRVPLTPVREREDIAPALMYAVRILLEEERRRALDH